MAEGDKNAGVAEDEDNEGYDGGEDESGPNLVVMSVDRRHCHLPYVLVCVSGLFHEMLMKVSKILKNKGVLRGVSGLGTHTSIFTALISKAFGRFKTIESTIKGMR